MGLPYMPTLTPPWHHPNVGTDGSPMCRVWVVRYLTPTADILPTTTDDDGQAATSPGGAESCEERRLGFAVGRPGGLLSETSVRPFLDYSISLFSGGRLLTW